MGTKPRPKPLNDEQREVLETLRAFTNTPEREALQKLWALDGNVMVTNGHAALFVRADTAGFDTFPHPTSFDDTNGLREWWVGRCEELFAFSGPPQPAQEMEDGDVVMPPARPAWLTKTVGVDLNLLANCIALGDPKEHVSVHAGGGTQMIEVRGRGWRALVMPLRTALCVDEKWAPFVPALPRKPV